MCDEIKDVDVGYIEKLMINKSVAGISFGVSDDSSEMNCFEIEFNDGSIVLIQGVVAILHGEPVDLTGPGQLH